MCYRSSVSLAFLGIVTCFLLCAVKAKGQQNDLNFTSLSSKDGLSSNTVHAILKDRYGLLWIGTQEGLSKYNGTNFIVYQHNANDTTSLQANEVVALHEDKKGRIWVGTIGGGLHCYDRKKDSFYHYKNDFTSSGTTSINIKSLHSDYAGKIWIATLFGLNILDPATNTISNFTGRKDVPEVIAKGIILSVFEDHKKQMWVGTREGLFKFNRGTNSFKAYSRIKNNSNSLVSDTVKTIAEDNSGNLWLGTAGGLSKMMPDGKTFKNFTYRSNDPATINSNFIYSIAAGTGHYLWVGTESGLCVLNTVTGSLKRYEPNARNVFSLSGKSVRSVLYDKSGIFWVGTYSGGINKFDQNLTFFGFKNSNVYDPQGLNGPVVTSFAEGHNGEIYVGTDVGGLNIYDRKTENFIHVPIKPQKKAGSLGLSILALANDRNQNLWVGTFQDGLFRVDTKTGRFRQYLQGAGEFNINHNEIFCLKVDSKGKLWIGTNGAGVNVYDPGSLKFTKYSKSDYSANGQKLPINPYIRVIEEDRLGRIWIGSYGTGIAIFDPATNRFSVLRKANKKLPSDNISSILQDSKGRMWVGTNGGGLVLLDIDNKSYRSFSVNEGLATGLVHKILEDSKGNLWLSTTKGISHFNTKTFKIVNYNSYNGLQNNSFVPGAGMQASDGTLFWGGAEGFNYINPLKTRTNPNIPAILLTSLVVNNRTISAADSNVVTGDIAVSKNIRLDYKQNFSISYVALNYTSPKQNKYLYRLKGFEKEWNDAGAKTTAYYTNIGPGHYTFEVRASNNDGVWNKVGISIPIIVKPPLWMTVYAYILYAFILGSAIFYLRYAGIKKLKAEFAAEQKKQESDRLHDLDRMKIKFLTNLSHEFRTPISLILAPADKLLEMQKDDGVAGQVNMIKRNARRLLNLVNQLLDFRRMEERELKLHSTEGEMVAFVQDVVESFRDLSESKRVSLSFKSGLQSLNMAFDHDKIERILFNLLSNAFKFTPSGGSVKVLLGLEENKETSRKPSVFITVSDTGIGIQGEKKDEIFELFNQGNQSASLVNQGSGIGLCIAREFVHMHGGEISVESTEGKGSDFTVSIPCTTVKQAYTTQIKDDCPEPADAVNTGDNRPVLKSTKTGLPTVLILEDDDDFRFYLKDNLRTHYQILEAVNGNEGWQKALASHPDLIVSDISMPLMDGIKFSKKIKLDKRTSQIPVVLLTAATGEHQELEGLSSGANDYLTKPFNFEILQTKIRNLLQFNSALKTAYSKQLSVLPTELEIESKNERFIKDVYLYVENNLINPQLSVEDLSRHLCMSRSTLYHKLLEITGQTPIELIKTIKLERAAALLEKSNLNINEIAFQVGFASPNYFSKAFKAKYKVLPSKFIEIKKNEVE